MSLEGGKKVGPWPKGDVTEGSKEGKVQGRSLQVGGEVGEAEEETQRGAREEASREGTMVSTQGQGTRR